MDTEADASKQQVRTTVEDCSPLINTIVGMCPPDLDLRTIRSVKSEIFTEVTSEFKVQEDNCHAINRNGMKVVGN